MQKSRRNKAETWWVRMSRIDVVHARAGKGATDGDWEKPVHTHTLSQQNNEVDGGYLPLESERERRFKVGKEGGRSNARDDAGHLRRIVD